MKARGNALGTGAKEKRRSSERARQGLVHGVILDGEGSPALAASPGQAEPPMGRRPLSCPFRADKTWDVPLSWGVAPGCHVAGLRPRGTAPRALKPPACHEAGTTGLTRHTGPIRLSRNLDVTWARDNRPVVLRVGPVQRDVQTPGAGETSAVRCRRVAWTKGFGYGWGE